jgi:DNA-binding SARP family transcriptional activator
VGKVYAGKAEDLTAERLRALAATLAGGPAPATAAGVRIRLFGPARLERDGRSAAPPRAKALALLALLAAHDRPQPRERLLALLWPDSDEAAAHKNLRNLLWRLRAAIGPQVVEGEAELALGEGAWVDVRAFEAARRVLETPGADAEAVLLAGEEAARLYGGDLLDGVALDEAADFELWLVGTRDRYREAYLGGLLALAAAYGAAGRWAEAGRVAQAGLAVDALNELLARALMEAQARLGDRAGALRQYDRLRAALDQDLGVAPLPETEALRAAILAGALPPAPAAAAPVRSPAVDAAEAADRAPSPSSAAGAEDRAAAVTSRPQDWGEAPDTTGFVGRRDELATLRRWVVEERCRLVAVLGMGGIGKTSLAAALARAAAPAFERVYWRSLRDAPPPGEWLGGAIGFLSDQRLVPPASEAERLAAALELLRSRRCLLVLDNVETVFEPGQQAGRYRAGLAGYGRLLEALGGAAHRSCLLLTSREAPPELAVLGGDAVRAVELGGLGVDEARALLAPKRLAGAGREWAELTARVGGNGLALKLVGESIGELFGGEIGPFLAEAGAGGAFGGIRRLLAGQVGRSSAPEQQVLRALAVAREPVRVGALLAALGPRVGRGAALEAVEGLRRRSLVERAEAAGAAAVTLQSVVLEYVTERLVEEAAEEIAGGRPARLVEQPLIQAQARDDVRQSQERLLGAPILERLGTDGGAGGAERRLLALLDGWRDRPTAEQGYGPGSVVNLLRLLRGDLRGLNLSRLGIRQAYLAEVDAQDASLADAHLAEAVLAEAFTYPLAVALSADGALLAAGTSTGEVHLWRVADRTPLLMAPGHTGAVRGVALSACRCSR